MPLYAVRSRERWPHCCACRSESCKLRAQRRKPRRLPDRLVEEASPREAEAPDRPAAGPPIPRVAEAPDRPAAGPPIPRVAEPDRPAAGPPIPRVPEPDLPRAARRMDPRPAHRMDPRRAHRMGPRPAHRMGPRPAHRTPRGGTLTGVPQAAALPGIHPELPARATPEERLMPAVPAERPVQATARQATALRATVMPATVPRATAPPAIPPPTPLPATPKRPLPIPRAAPRSTAARTAMSAPYTPTGWIFITGQAALGPSSAPARTAPGWSAIVTGMATSAVPSGIAA